MRCVITGCALVYDDEWVAGDLFDAGECWIFGGNMKDRHAEWRSMPTHYDKTIEPREWWERHGIFVMFKRDAILNEAARAYIRE